MSLFSKGTSLFLAGLVVVPSAYAMCLATTKNLVRLEVHACQPVTIHASSSKPPAHAIHRRGSRIAGALVTGRVVESTLVWDGDASMAEYLFETGAAATDETSTFFLRGDASELCPDLIGTEATLVTDPPCCDTLPADGICLVPSTLPIARLEDDPDRWVEWLEQDPQ